MVLYNGCTGNLGTLVENPAAVDSQFLNMSMTPNPYIDGQSVTFAARLTNMASSGIAGAPVQLKKGGVNVGTPINTAPDGQFEKVVADPGAGVYTVVFDGGDY